jgi:hypothetical protein
MRGLASEWRPPCHAGGGKDGICAGLTAFVRRAGRNALPIPKCHRFLLDSLTGMVSFAVLQRKFATVEVA